MPCYILMSMRQNTDSAKYIQVVSDAILELDNSFVKSIRYPSESVKITIPWNLLLLAIPEDKKGKEFKNYKASLQRYF